MTCPLHLDLPYRMRQDVDWARKSETVKMCRVRFF
jgi:hypothetical protein